MVVFASVLAGCASTPLTAPPNSAPIDVEIMGRISVQYRAAGDDHDQGLHGAFDWVERGSTVDLSLLDPLGQTVALVHRTPTNATLTPRDGHPIEGANAEELTTRVLGWRLPVDGLRYWLKGQSSPDSAAKQYQDGDGTRIIEQDGWRVSYAGDDGPPPRKLDLRYTGSGAMVTLRIVIDQR